MLFVLGFIFILDRHIPISELRLNLTLYLFFFKLITMHRYFTNLSAKEGALDIRI